MKYSLLSVLCILFIWANGNTTDMNLVVDVGQVSPWGDISPTVEAAYYGNLGVSYVYAPRLHGYLQGGYSYLPVRSDAYAGLHQLNGRAGLEYSPGWIEPLALGAGISLLFVRGDSIAPEATQYMLYDNESEFGWHARLSMPVLRQQAWCLGVRAHWEEVWTQPSSSQLLWIGLYLEGAPW